MLQDSILIWKLLSLLFFAILIFFILYIILEKFLNKAEFKRRLRLVKDQLLFDIFRDYKTKVSEFLDLDEVSKVEIETRKSLSELKKYIFCHLSKYDLKDLEQKVNESFNKKEKLLNKIILNKYKDAIKSLNSKLIYLKNDLDTLKSTYISKGDLGNKFEKQNDIQYQESQSKKELEDGFYSSIKDKEEAIKEEIDNLVKDKHKLQNEEDYISLKSSIKNIENSINKKIYESHHSNYVKLRSSISDIEKSIDIKINNMIETRDAYMEKQINYLMQNNEKLSADKMRTIEQLQDKTDNFMKDSLSKIYELLKWKDKIIEEKDKSILEQKNNILELQKQLFKQNSLIETKINQYSMDKKYLDNYIFSLKKQTKIQSIKNNIFIFAIITLFLITMIMFILVLTKSPLIYTLY
jgi:phage terminase small subunit